MRLRLAVASGQNESANQGHGGLLGTVERLGGRGGRAESVIASPNHPLFLADGAPVSGIHPCLLLGINKSEWGLGQLMPTAAINQPKSSVAEPHAHLHLHFVQ